MMNDPDSALDLRQLRYLVAVADEASFTRAATHLGISQPGLSSAVQRLEAELGTPLLERTPRQVLPTPAGRELVAAAQSLLAAAREARQRVAAAAHLDAGEVSIGSVQTFTSVDLPALLAELHRGHPGIRISLREDTTSRLLADVVDGGLDLAFVALDADPVPTALQVLHTYEEELVVIPRPGSGLAGRGEVTPAELTGEVFVDFQAGTGLQTVVAALCRDAGVQRRIAFGASQMSMVLSLVGHGLGIAVVPRPVAEGSGLAVIGLGGLRRRLALVARSGETVNPAARVLLALLPEGTGERNADAGDGDPLIG